MASTAATSHAKQQMWSPLQYEPSYVLHNRSIWLDEDAINVFDVAGFLSRVESPLRNAVPNANVIIKRACLEHNVNPRWVLATLQKEQSLIEGDPTEERLEWAMGYGVPDSGVKIKKFAGFTKQVFAAVAGMRRYCFPEAKYYAGKHIRRPMSVDGTAVFPVNIATAACYVYTPHMRGNRLLWDIYRKYWGGPGKSKAEQFVDTVREQIGKPYVWGAETDDEDPDPKAFDCSELVEWGLARIGIDFPDGSATQARASKSISVGQARITAGALVFRVGTRDGRHRVVHVGISDGAGNVIHAKGKAYGTIVEELVIKRWHLAGVVPQLRDV
jgi:hypothetical protein